LSKRLEIQEQRAKGQQTPALAVDGQPGASP
jgi:hypothetical protein